MEAMCEAKHTNAIFWNMKFIARVCSVTRFFQRWPDYNDKRKQDNRRGEKGRTKVREEIVLPCDTYEIPRRIYQSIFGLDYIIEE
jgi:hypothetical protein